MNPTLSEAVTSPTVRRIPEKYEGLPLQILSDARQGGSFFVFFLITNLPRRRPVRGGGSHRFFLKRGNEHESVTFTLESKKIARIGWIPASWPLRGTAGQGSFF
jgi:hypothetical protein